jgi:hypothetical protein
MYETPDEVAALQRLMDASHSVATRHLRDIITDERTLRAADLVALLTGMKVLSLATVTARGEPRISAVDGHFLHATWTFSTDGGAAKAKHMQARPVVSVAHVDGEALGVFGHGRVERMAPADPDWDETLRHWIDHYESSPFDWGEDIRMYRFRPTWMVGYAFKRSELLAARGIEP